MNLYAFLSTLPAVLGLAGFFAYLWAGRSRIGGEVFKKIVDKLRADPNVDVRDYASLTPSKVRTLALHDAAIRNAVNEQDRRLLWWLIVLQHATTIIVLAVCAALVGWTAWLVSRPQPLSVVLGPPKAVVDQARGLLVDLDAVAVEWTSGGRPEELSVFLENVDTGARSSKRSTSSGVRTIQFEAADVAMVAIDRRYGKVNRIRAVAEWADDTTASTTADLHVGIQVELMLNGRAIDSDGGERAVHTLFATIDRSTEHMPPDYCFSGDFVCFADSTATVVALQSCNRNGEVTIPQLESVNWARPYAFVYHGPDDDRLVRTRVTGNPSAVSLAADGGGKPIQATRPETDPPR